MLGLAKKLSPPKKDHSNCSGCSLCLLVCPVWRRTRDISLTPHGRAKALQNGASVNDIAVSINCCTLCMACEPVCPENIGLTSMMLDLRRGLAAPLPELQARMQESSSRPHALATNAPMMFLPDPALLNRADLLAQISKLLGGNDAVADDSVDISLALEAGVEIPAPRMECFLAPLRKREKIVVGDGMLLRHLRDGLPGVRIVSLGEALSALPAVRQGLRKDDLYVIEPRAYHSDYARLVKYYAALRVERGCAFNLDLQRIAIPATARSLSQRIGRASVEDDAVQGRWLLQGRTVTRIVVENWEDGLALEKITNIPVVHLAEVCQAVSSGNARDEAH